MRSREYRGLLEAIELFGRQIRSLRILYLRVEHEQALHFYRLQVAFVIDEGVVDRGIFELRSFEGLPNDR